MFQVSTLPTLKGRTFIVTGGNTGIGFVTCLNLVAHDARVYMGARSEAKANKAILEIKTLHPDADIHLLLLDHASLSSVVEAAKRFISQEKQLHGLILNGGIMAVPYELTKDGFESQFQVNYLAHWLLTSHLLPTLLSTAQTTGPGSVRVVCVSSEGHQKSSFGVERILYDTEEIKNFGNFGRYGLSKLANVMQAKTLNDEYGPGSKTSIAGNGEIWTGSLHPGFIDTQLNENTRDSSPWYLAWIHRVLILARVIRPVDEGCLSSLYVGASPEFKAAMSGKYFDHKTNLRAPNPAAEDPEERRKLELWTVEKMTAGGWL
jgi:NAD(P)-dependent dehydrogenase (short-subunit alcohol dehydrogenase family)